MNEFQFGRQTVRTKVNMMTSPELKALPFDVVDFLVAKEAAAKKAAAPAAAAANG